MTGSQNRFQAGLRRGGVATLLAIALAGGAQVTAYAETNPLVPEAIQSVAAQDAPRQSSFGQAKSLRSTQSRKDTSKSIQAAGVSGSGSEDVFADAQPGCATDVQTAQLEVSVAAIKTQDLAYTLTDGAAAVTTGTVHVKGDKYFKIGAEFTVPALAAGSYGLDFRAPGKTKVLVHVPVLVVRCITAEVSCKAITFTNPASNPEVDVTYGSPEEKDDSPFGNFLVTLQPGESHSIRTDLGTVAYEADAYTDETYSEAGSEEKLSVPQDCTGPTPVPGDNSLATFGLTGCASKTGKAAVQLYFERLSDIAVHYEIRNAKNAVVASGDSVGKSDAPYVGSAKLPGTGIYHYASYVDGSTVAYEQADLQVYGCLKVKVTCHHVKFTNPNDARVEVIYSRANGKSGKEASLKAGKSKRVKWTHKDMAYDSYVIPSDPESAQQFFSSAGAKEKLKTHRC